MPIPGSTFETPIKTLTDIAGGGIFFYINYKKRLSFDKNGNVELTWIVVDYKWSWQDYFADTKFVGTFQNPSMGYYTVECALKHVSKEIKLSIAGLLIKDKQLVCSCYTESGNRERSYFDEIFEMVEV